MNTEMGIDMRGSLETGGVLQLMPTRAIQRNERRIYKQVLQFDLFIKFIQLEETNKLLIEFSRSLIRQLWVRQKDT